MKKKIFTLIATVLCITMIASIFTSCGKKEEAKPSKDAENTKTSESSENKSEKVEVSSLTVWLPPLSANQDDKEVWDEIMKPFEEERGVSVNVEIVPWGNYEEKYLTGVASGEGPDVGYMYMEMISDFIDMGTVYPFDEFLTDKDNENYLYLQNGIIQGKQYCLPIVVGNAVVMCYNKDILEANNITEIPETWEEFIETCKQIETDTDGDGKDDTYRFIQKWGNPAISTLNTSFYPYLWQSGGELYNEELTRLTIDSEAGKKAIQFLYDLRFEHDILPDFTTSLTEDDCINYFAEGKVAFVEMETTNTRNFDEAGINYGYITSLKNPEMSTFVASDALVLMSSAEDKQLAFDLVQHMLSGPSMTRYHQSAQFPPIAKDEEYNDNPQFERVYSEDIGALQSLPAVKGSSKIYDMLYKNLQLMMIGELEPEKVIEETIEYADIVLNE